MYNDHNMYIQACSVLSVEGKFLEKWKILVHIKDKRGGKNKRGCNIGKLWWGFLVLQLSWKST